MVQRKQTIPAPALLLGLSGLLPFIASALAICAGRYLDDNSVTEIGIEALGAYGAIILSFLGGVRWGNLLNDKVRLKRWGPLIGSVVPSLIAWPALLLSPLWMLSLLAAGFVLQYALDVEAVKNRVIPVWYGKLRLILTTGAELALLSGMVALAL